MDRKTIENLFESIAKLNKIKTNLHMNLIFFRTYAILFRFSSRIIMLLHYTNIVINR